MPEGAPPPLAPSVQLDEDLINYEVDDFDATTTATGPATDVTASKMTITQTSETIQEIDWEDNDQTGGDSVDINGGLDGGASLDAVDANAASFDVDVNGSASDVAKPANTTAAGDDTFNDLDVNLGQSTEINGPGKAGGQEVEHEIDYDDDDDEDVDAVAAAPKQETEEDLIDYESFPDDPVEADGAADAQDMEDEDDFQAHDENEVIDASAGNQSEEQSDEDEGSPVDDGECPDIAVTYRNEEFPLFHGQKNFEGQDGFFHDQSILDHTMDGLLRKFRHELAGDIGPQDEIVLQIDEMGLEYAESTARDHCASVTLRQVHEIFEQLSKNQDPDATRTLYTNLIIRPHPAKRLDLLINEAFNGKGLDDVMYSFSHQEARPPVQHEGVVDVYGGDSSEADDDGSGGQEEEAEDEGQEDEEQEDEDLASNADIDESAENQENDIDQDEYDDKAEDEIVDMLDLDDDAAPVQDFGGQDEYDETENGLDTMGQPPQDLASDNAFENTDFQTDQGTGADGDENAGFDLLDFPDEDATAQPDQANKGNTSATVTLNGDGENEITYEDDAFNGTGNVTGGVAGDGAHGDEFQEIDWRDGPDDDAGVSLDTSIPSKRPHSEVEVDLSVDDENDVKRRRS